MDTADRAHRMRATDLGLPALPTPPAPVPAQPPAGVCSVRELFRSWALLLGFLSTVYVLSQCVETYAPSWPSWA